jgi:hypothetical protein
MRQKTINLRNQESFDKKSPDPKSHTQMGSLRAKKASEKFSRLGTFKTERTNATYHEGSSILFAYVLVLHLIPEPHISCNKQK